MQPLDGRGVLIAFVLLILQDNLNVFIGKKGEIGSYMSAHVLLNLLKKWSKEIKCEAC